MSKPAQSWCTKLVDPLALRTPVALAGPGVSSPTTAMSDCVMPAREAAIARPSAICCRQIAGPSWARAGCSQRPSISQRPSVVMKV